MPPFMGIPPQPPYPINLTTSDMFLQDSIPLVKGQKYYWRVMVQESIGGDGSYASGSFTVVPNPPDAPALSSPAHQAVGVSLAPQLSWSSAARAVSYRAEVAADSSFPAASTQVFATNDLSAAAAGLAPSTLYYWHVRAENGGGASDYSSTRSFTTVPPPPAAPALVSPADHATGVPVSLTLQWGSSAGAVSYRVQLSADSNFSATVLDDSGSATDHAAGPLAKAATYYWRARAKNAGGAGDWASARRFTTELPPPPAQPSLIAPASAKG